ncbi:uncharacterized protein LOC122261528 [Penaeus japonicus]|uniref:uncharacterized protein LOC122261528 n=1 Tax=Penaeus japonicus TaxID=27405 RepID=UPI001C7118F0|nr:uncharacterized protein LOC122261528 [Penaeus japonicus]XP_042885156.1 uncharacterized protein LOC122261528 [Penaeus japonicus]XP_042885157.1 uncharacterized protein LOC122261528 [Penaeus japonicus]
MSQVTVRPARRCDCAAIYELVRQMAENRNARISHNISIKGLEEAGFGSQSACNILVAEDKRGLVGYVLYYYCYSWEGRCVCVEDMYVRQSKGHEDITEALWRNLVKIALDEGCKQFNFPPLRENKNEFYHHKTINMTKTDGYHYFRMEQEALENFVKLNKMPEGVKVKEATFADCTGINQLIRDLAMYEKVPDKPQIDAKALEDDGFGDKVFFKSYVAEAEGNIIGYTLFFHTYNWEGRGVYMEDLYVSPSFRGIGVGTALWKKVLEACLAEQGNRCDFCVLGWNMPSIEFYKGKGARDMTEEDGFIYSVMPMKVMKEFLQ